MDQANHQKSYLTRFLQKALIAGFLISLLTGLSGCRTHKEVRSEEFSQSTFERQESVEIKIKPALFQGSEVSGEIDLIEWDNLPTWKRLRFTDTAQGHSVEIFKDDSGKVRVLSTVKPRIQNTEVRKVHSVQEQTNHSFNSIHQDKRTEPLFQIGYIRWLILLFSIIGVLGFLKRRKVAKG